MNRFASKLLLALLDAMALVILTILVALIFKGATLIGQVLP